MSPTNYSQEESLSSGLDRQLNQFKDVQQQLANFGSDLTRLKTSCDQLKQQRTQLQIDCAEGERDKRSLHSEIGRIKTERDALQLEFAGMVDDERLLRDADAVASMERDASGKVARKLWLQTEKVRELEEKLGQTESLKQNAVAAEREVATSLRERLATVEREMKEKEESSDEFKSQRRRSLEHDVAVLQAEVGKLRNENQDLRDSARSEAKHRRAAESRVHVLSDRLQTAQEEARHLKDNASDWKEIKDKLDKETKRAKAAVEERDRLRVQLDEMTAERDKLASRGSPRALQPMSPNLPPSAPRTPTKAMPPSSHDSDAASRSGTPNTSLAKNYEYLQRKHRELKTQFDQMRAKYAKDIQHWKDYRAIQIARQELRQKRRDEKKSESVGDAPSGSVCVPSSDPASVPPEEDPPRPPSPPTPKRRNRDTSATRTPLARTTVSAPAPPSQPAQAVNLSSTKAASTPTKAPSTTTFTPKREFSTPNADRTVTRQPSRVTPWLGTSVRKTSDSSSSARKRRDSFPDDDDPPIKRGSGSGVRTPLVRDRTGASVGEGSTSLRRAALQRSVTNVHDNDRDDPCTSLGPTTPDSERERKRKLDHEGLSPVERAAERKKLSRLSVSERREVYAAYKQKGRYVHPEELQRTVADDYEIDPARNDGVAHQFHSVVRNREERKKMHGGDCECCRDYYEAIGSLPRFNQAPLWKDDPEAEAEAEDPEDGYNRQLADHQNRISRHREVWRKPPTPPDYWKIGFPSTQDVERVNEQADEMARRRDAEMRQSAAHRDSKWRKKQ